MTNHLPAVALIAASLLSGRPGGGFAVEADPLPEAIREAVAARRGLVVQVECAGASRLAALGRTKGTTVQGLTRDAEKATAMNRRKFNENIKVDLMVLQPLLVEIRLCKITC